MLNLTINPIRITNMSTFISTSLTKRTGAGTTVFSPSGVQGEMAYLRAPGTHALNGSFIRVNSKVTEHYRRTAIRVVVPQVDADGMIIARPAADLSVYVPAGSLSTDVDDIVGYMNGLTASGLSNFNDMLVNGVGVY